MKIPIKYLTLKQSNLVQCVCVILQAYNLFGAAIPGEYKAPVASVVALLQWYIGHCAHNSSITGGPSI